MPEKLSPLGLCDKFADWRFASRVPDFFNTSQTFLNLRVELGLVIVIIRKSGMNLREGEMRMIQVKESVRGPPVSEPVVC